LIVLGIDPGTAITGYGLIKEKNKGQYETMMYGCIRTDAKMLMPSRLKIIYEEVGQIIDTYHPDAIAVEQLFFNTNARTAIAVGQARGTILLAAANRNLLVSEYTPLQVKQAVVGYGRAEKEQIQYMVKTILGLKQIPKPDDAADALAIALCCLQSSEWEQQTKRGGLQ
jgi:crossover junction endodeoxyribonuclease RuvC